MYAVSDTFLAMLRGPHRIAVKVQVASSQSGPWTDVTGRVSAGSVTIDRGADTRRSLSMSIAGFFTPTEPATMLDPYGKFLKVSRGIYLPGGTVEYVPLGIFRIYETTIDKDSVEITAYSREVDLRDSRFPLPYQVTTATSLHTTITNVIQNAISGATVNFASGLSNPTVQRALFEKDRMEALDELVYATGGELSCDVDGNFVIRPPADPSDPPVWTVDAGRTGVLVEYTKTFSREGVYNGVVVSNANPANPMTTATNTAAPIVVLVVDSDTSSPTYWGGPFGKIPRFYTSSFISTRAQALSAGRAILAKEKGLSTKIDFSAIANPALDVDDVVEVVYPDGSSENHLIDQLTIGLTPEGGMTAATRGIQTEES